MTKVLAVSIGALALALVACKAHKTPTTAFDQEAVLMARTAKAPDPMAFYYEAPTVVVTASGRPRTEQVVIFWEAPMVTIHSPRPKATTVAEVNRSPAKPKL